MKGEKSVLSMYASIYVQGISFSVLFGRTFLLYFFARVLAVLMGFETSMTYYVVDFLPFSVNVYEFQVSCFLFPLA